MSEYSRSNMATVNSASEFNSPYYKLTDTEDNNNPNAKVIPIHSIDEPFQNTQSSPPPPPPPPQHIHKTHHNDLHLSQSQTTTQYYHPSAHSIQHQNQQQRKQSLASIATTPSPEPYHLSSYNNNNTMNSSTSAPQRQIYRILEETNPLNASQQFQKINNNPQQIHNEMSNINDTMNNKQNEKHVGNEQEAIYTKHVKRKRRASQPHIHQTMMYEPIMDTFSPSSSTNVTFSANDNVTKQSRNITDNNDFGLSSPHSLQTPHSLPTSFYTKRQLNELRMKHFNEQHKLNTFKSNNNMHTKKKRRRHSVSTNLLQNNNESSTKPNGFSSGRPRIKRGYTPSTVAYLNQNYDNRQSHPVAVYRTHKTTQQESKSIETRTTKYSYYPPPQPPIPPIPPKSDNNPHIDGNNGKNGRIPRYRPILNNETMSLPLGKPTYNRHHSHHHLGQHPVQNPYIDETIASPTISSTISSPNTNTTTTNTTTPTFSSTSTYNAAMTSNGTPIIMRYEKKTKISRRRSKTSEEVVTDHMSPNGGHHRYESKIKIKRKKKKNKIQRCKSYDNSYSYYDDVNAEDEEYKEEDEIKTKRKKRTKHVSSKHGKRKSDHHRFNREKSEVSATKHATSGSGSGSGFVPNSSGSEDSASMYLSTMSMDNGIIQKAKKKKRKKLKKRKKSKSRSKHRNSKKKSMDHSFTPTAKQISKSRQSEESENSKQKTNSKSRRNRTESDVFNKQILRVREGKLGQRVVTFSRRKSLLMRSKTSKDFRGHDDKKEKEKITGIDGIEARKDGMPLMSPLSQLSNGGSVTAGSHSNGEYLMELQKLLEDEKSKLDAQRLKMENLLNKMQDQHKDEHNKFVKQKEDLKKKEKEFETKMEEKEAEYKRRLEELEKKEKEYEERQNALKRDELSNNVTKRRMLRKEKSINRQQQKLVKKTLRFDSVLSEFYIYQKTINSTCNKHIQLINKWRENAEKMACNLTQFTTNPLQDMLQNLLKHQQLSICIV